MSNRADRRRKEREQRRDEKQKSATHPNIAPAIIGNQIKPEKIGGVCRDVEIARSVAKNGFTYNDLAKYFERGREEGFKQASHIMIHSYYSATVISAHKLFGFGQERLVRLLNEIEQQILLTMTDEELAKRAFMETGVEVDPTEPFERAQFGEKVKEWRKEKNESLCSRRKPDP